MARDKSSPQPPTQLTTMHPDVLVNSADLGRREVAECAKVIVAFFCGLDPGWAAKIDAVRDERHFTDEQICMLFMANTLDQDQHMVLPSDHPFFTAEHMPQGREGICPECLKPFERQYPGQPLCGNECANRFYTRSIDEQQERRDLANSESPTAS